MKKIIVNADDLGYAPGVNRGILDAHRKGILTSTTVMINLPHAPAALDLMAAEAPNLGIGLHLTLTAGPPVSPPDQVASLLGDNGHFKTLQQWTADMDSADPDHVRRELTAQVARFREWTGRLPDHLDSHHHICYLLPAGLRAMLDIAAEHDLPMRSAGLDMPPDERLRLLRDLLGGLPDDAARRLIDRLQAVLESGPPPRFPARFDGTFFAQKATLGHLLVILTTLPDDSVTEIMCHPGYVDAALTGGYREPRETEIEHLTHAATRECVQSEGIQLVTFGDV
ncbi:MAG: ChbG/HpnK family deacetylase [Anaerolineae bacterium]|nr:ChbG/HpnK family deacetylase [Anaerolineae bacterium]